jgi:uncharacterized protein YdiU (UPF0061 family)
MGEAMHALGIPTTRVLAAVATGEPVHRETVLPGAVLSRVAASHLRVGTFEFAARRSTDLLREVAGYAVERHFPALAGLGEPARWVALLREVAARQAALVAAWMGVGFIHGVMNTDNMAISGETIDYGPCAFLEAYHPRTAFSSIDHGRRYAYGNQPMIALWNLARFAETLVPLAARQPTPEAAQEAAEALTEVLAGFESLYQAEWSAVMRRKLGLADGPAPEGAGFDTVLDADGSTTGAAGLPARYAGRPLAEAYLELLRTHRVDFTLGFRHLVAATAGPDGEAELRSLFTASSDHPDGPFVGLDDWLARWREELALSGFTPDRRAAMERADPLYVPRNHLVEEAITAAVEKEDLQPFQDLLDVLADPFTRRAGLDRYAEAAPAEVTAYYRTFCGT